MNRSLLALLGLVVLGGAIGLVLWLREGPSDTRPAAATPGSQGSGISATVPPPPSTRAHAGVHVTSDPSTAPDDEAPPREYAVGDVEVRDHRSGDQVPIDVPPNLHPPEARRVPSSLTSSISTQVRGVIRSCAASVPPEVRGANPHADGLISIEIKNHQAQVTKTTIQLRDVVGAAVEPTRQCIEQGALGLHVDTDEADLTDYGITISFRLP